MTGSFRAISGSVAHIYIAADGLLYPSGLLVGIYGGGSLGITPSLCQSAVNIAGLNPSETQLCVTHSPNKRYIASLTSSGTIRIWQSFSTHPILMTTLNPPNRCVWIQFLPDSAQIVCGFVDQSLVIWDINPFQRVKTLQLKFDPVLHDQFVTTPLTHGYNESPKVSYAADAGFRILGILLEGTEMKFWDTRTWRRRPLGGLSMRLESLLMQQAVSQHEQQWMQRSI